MEWSGATIENDGFSMVLGQPTIGNDGFSMVGHHWSNDGMVTYHRWSLSGVLLQAGAEVSEGSVESDPDETKMEPGGADDLWMLATPKSHRRIRREKRS